MEQITNYIKPELLIVAFVLYFIGVGLKKSQAVKDKYIPLILGAVSVIVCAAWVFAGCPISTYRDVIMALFTAFTQGVLVAGLSTYAHQIIKQTRKKE